MATQKNGQDTPDCDPEPDPHPPHGFTNVWPLARPVLQLLQQSITDHHQGLHLAAQALMVIGDLTAISLQGRRR